MTKPKVKVELTLQEQLDQLVHNLLEKRNILQVQFDELQDKIEEIDVILRGFNKAPEKIVPSNLVNIPRKSKNIEKLINYANSHNGKVYLSAMAQEEFEMGNYRTRVVAYSVLYNTIRQYSEKFTKLNMGVYFLVGYQDNESESEGAV